MLPVVYLQEITVSNLPYALALSLRNCVVAWRIDVPRRFARRFVKLRAHELFSWDEWMLLEDACYAKWKETVLPHYRAAFRCEVNYRGERIDFSQILWQHLGSSFERFYLFLKAANRHQAQASRGRCYVVAPLIAGTLPSGLMEELATGMSFGFSHVAGFFEAVHYWNASVSRVASGLRTYLRGLLEKRMKLNEKKIFWTGIAPQEIPAADHQLNFAWVAQYSELPREDVLFFLSSELSEKQRAYLDAQRIEYVDPQALFRLLPRRTGAFALGFALASLLADLLQFRTVTNAHRSRFLARALVWLEVARLLKPSFYFTTTSGCWPEQPEIAALKPLGVRTIIWAYSANNLRFTVATPEFRDNTVYRSLFVSDEYWTWNQAVSKWLERIQVDPVHATTRFRVVGAHMCGNRDHLRRAPAEARELMGLPETGFYISIFDVPSVSDLWLDRYAGGPRFISLEYAEAFFSGIHALLEKLPEVRVILKLKRSLDDWSRIYPASLHRLLDRGQESNGSSRVFVPDINIDPYLPIAACDAALGMFFTSPVLLALTNGRHGAYYDPLGMANFPTDEQYLQLTLRSEASLVNAVQSWIANPGPPRVPPVERLLPPAVKDSFRHICYDAGPAEPEKMHG